MICILQRHPKAKKKANICHHLNFTPTKLFNIIYNLIDPVKKKFPRWIFNKGIALRNLVQFVLIWHYVWKKKNLLKPEAFLILRQQNSYKPSTLFFLKLGLLPFGLLQSHSKHQDQKVFNIKYYMGGRIASEHRQCN